MDNRFIIAIGSYNNEEWVTPNMDSVLSQTYPNFKIVYYNAASTDKTLENVQKYADKDSRINLQSTKERNLKTWFFENLEKMEDIRDNDIVCILDGDDFLANEEVLNYLNEVYNQTNCWMTYGGMIVWEGGDKTTQPFPQNSMPPEEVFVKKLYRQDLWRYSHMRTCRGFLWKRLKKSDLKSSHDGNYMSMCDLCTVYPFLEMCPPNKIFRVEESIYILNVSKNNGCRSYEELRGDNLGQIYEREIRSRPKYSELSVVSPSLSGGLGNQLFEIAAAASLAKDNDALLVVNPSEHILPNQGRNVNNYVKNIFSRIVFDKNPPLKTSYNWDKPYYAPIPYQPNIKLGGHYQSYKYFDHNREYIQNLFLPKEMRKPYEITALHVRRGDYIKFPNHHPLLPVEYYIKAVEMCGAKNIVIYSDDKTWCKENLKFDDKVQVHWETPKDDWEELYQMSHCKNIIISNSSFGWWAAYLNTRQDRSIYVPKQWYGPAYIDEGFKIDDLVMPEWIKI